MHHLLILWKVMSIKYVALLKHVNQGILADNNELIYLKYGQDDL